MAYRLDKLQQKLKMSNEEFQAFRKHFANQEIWQRAKEHPFYAPYLQDILDKEQELSNTPITALRFSDYKLYDITGSRREYEREYFIRRCRLNTYVVLALMYEDERYISQLEDIIWAICDEYTWCLPAHLGGGLDIIRHGDNEVHGDQLYAKRRSHENIVDLFSAETAFALAETVAMLGERLSPIIRQRACEMITRRVFEPFMEVNVPFSWETVRSNWASVCAGGVGAAAMYLVKDEQLLAPIIKKTLDVMDYFLESFENDGVCAEGLAYWNYGFGYFTYYGELLLRRSKGEIDVFDNNKIAAIAAFQEKSYLSGDMVVSFSDGLPHYSYTLGLSHFLYQRFNTLLPEAQYAASFYKDECNRFPVAIRLFAFTNPDAEISGVGKYSYWLEDTQWLIAKQMYKDKGLALAAKGGHNDEPHNHNDIGSFILHYDGVNLLTDLGCGEYTRDYFAPQTRYGYLCNSSLGHSVPIIDGAAQHEGAEYTAKNVEYDEKAKSLSMELQGAYAVPQLTKLIRCITVLEGGVRLSDSYSLGDGSPEVVERFISLYPPTLISDNCVEVAHEGARLHIHFDCGQFSFRFDKTGFVDHSHRDVDVYTLDFDYIGQEKDFTATFDFKIE